MSTVKRKTQLEQFLAALDRIYDRLTSLDKKVEHYTEIALAERRESRLIAARLADHEDRLKRLEGVKA